MIPHKHVTYFCTDPYKCKQISQPEPKQQTRISAVKRKNEETTSY